MTTQYTVYWQPGCSSCLRAKEFLADHNIPYHSVNVREDQKAMDILSELGARSIPVVTKGEEFVFAQDLDALAKFVGVDLNRKMLEPEELIFRIDRILAAAQRYIRQLPDNALDTRLPGRDRSYFDLAYHVFMIPVAFLDAVKGGELSYDYFERTPPDSLSNATHIMAFGDTVRTDIKEWWNAASRKGMPERVNTYYGKHTTHSVLERTAWHTAQHVRQLMTLVVHQNIVPDGELGDEELAGLPLPEEVYDDEVKL